jgi:hypothetical protein
MRTRIFLALACWAGAGEAQTMYKCMDGQNRVTYSNIPCEKQGLREGGPVADRVTSMPFTAPPAPKAAAGTLPTVKLPVPADESEAGRGATQAKPVVPLIEKLAK